MHLRLVQPPAPGRPSAVALTLNRARRARGESLGTSARRSRLPLRYVAAFELDRAALVFRAPEGAAAFLGEYARHLGLDWERVVERFLADQADGPWAVRLRTGRRTARLARWRRRRRLRLRAAVGATVAMVAVVAVAWAGPRAGVEPVFRSGPHRDAPDPRRPELPRGGRTLFPNYRVVAFYGTPVTSRMGSLGMGSPADVASKLEAQARPYAGERRPVLPAFELISTITSSSPGSDGTHTFRLSDERIGEYLGEVRRIKGLLVIDIQPGRIPFDLEVRRYERWLRFPDVALALDPEWRVGPGEQPGRTVGSVDAAELNRAIDYVAGLVRTYDLPQKLVVIHQFNLRMVTSRDRVHHPEELAVTFDFDGVGTPQEKVQTYGTLARGLEDAWVGVKLYYDQDAALMSPRQVLALSPEPDLIVYQ